MTGIVNRLAMGLAWLAAPAAALGLAAPFLAQHWLSWDVLSHFALHSAVYLGALLIATVFRRRFTLVLITAGLAGAGTVFGLPFVWQALPSSSGGQGAGVKVLSFNLHGWVNTGLAPIEAMLREQKADLVLLLEFTPVQKPLLKRLKSLYPHQADCTGNGLCRLVVLSRHALRDMQMKARNSKIDQAPTLAEGWVDLPSGPVRFIGAHITRPLDPYGQNAQLTHIAGLASQHAGKPVIVAGDFNAAPWSYTVRNFQKISGLNCLNRFTPTWPMDPIPLAQFPIDQICISKQIQSGSFKALPATGSDHRPVQVQMEFQTQIAVQ